MGSLLREHSESNPLWQSQGTPLNPAVLFDAEGPSERARVSVINLSALPTVEEQQTLINALAMALFGWISRNRASAERPLRGLLVFDEANDFVPTARATPCKESLLKLVRQGRKYGLGLVFATREPTSIEHTVLANCATQIHGKASSPLAIERMRSQLQVRGGKGDDIARLQPGEFYVTSDGMSVPLKTATHTCLSWHPQLPMDVVELVERAQRPD
jgi:DNA helicase HerA-like ATPase